MLTLPQTLRWLRLRPAKRRSQSELTAMLLEGIYRSLSDNSHSPPLPHPHTFRHHKLRDRKNTYTDVRVYDNNNNKNIY